MMQKLHLSFKHLVGAFTIALVTCPAYSALRPLPDLPIVQSVTRAGEVSATRLAQLKPEGRWVLLILDANLPSTEKFLHSLSADGFDGDKTVVLFLGSQGNISYLTNNPTFPNKMRWASAEAKQVFPSLKIGGTPAIYAMNADNKIVWLRYGYPRIHANLLVPIWDWIRNKPVLVRGGR
jgi:hypothetical protein